MPGSKRQLVLDTETTGLSVAEGDRVIELGCVELINRRLTGNNLHLYFKTDRESSPEALRVHGIDQAFLADKPGFETQAKQIVEYLKGAELIIHNAPFDVGFLDHELQLCGHKDIRQLAASVIDTLVMARQLYPGKRNSLDALCDRLEVDRAGRTLHGALLDAQLLADVYIRLTRGQKSLGIEMQQPPRYETRTTATGPGLSTLDLPVLKASAEEARAHEALLADMAGANGGVVIWPADLKAL